MLEEGGQQNHHQQNEMCSRGHQDPCKILLYMLPDEHNMQEELHQTILYIYMYNLHFSFVKWNWIGSGKYKRRVDCGFIYRQRRI